MDSESDDKTDVIVVDGYRIDRASQKILLRLNTDSWTNGTLLREASELSQNGQVFYRIEEYLEPVGFVLEKPREDDTGGRGYHDRRKFRLTPEGASWLDEHEAEVSRPASRVETQQMAYEALDAAESAKESVQNYRKKVHRIKSYAEDVEEAVGKVQEMLEERSRQRDGIEQEAMKAQSDAHSALREVGDVEGRVEEVEDLQKEMANRIGERLREHDEELRELREENEQLRSEVEELRERLNRGAVDRFLGMAGVDSAD